jgi:hypothetical protein
MDGDVRRVSFSSLFMEISDQLGVSFLVQFATFGFVLVFPSLLLAHPRVVTPMLMVFTTVGLYDFHPSCFLNSCPSIDFYVREYLSDTATSQIRCIIFLTFCSAIIQTITKLDREYPVVFCHGVRTCFGNCI